MADTLGQRDTAPTSRVAMIERSERMDIAGRLAWNTITKWLSSLVSAIAAVLLVRYQRLYLGEEAFGAASLLMSVVFVMLLCDAGLRAVLSRHIAEHVARGDYPQVNVLFSSALFLVVVIGGSLAGLCLIAADLLVDAANFAVSQRADAIVLMRYYVPAAVLLSFIAPTFSSLIEAYHRFDIVDLAHVVEVLVRFVLMLVAIGVLQMGLFGWATALVVSQITLAVISIVSAIYLCPFLRIRLRYVQWAPMKRTLSLGSLVFVYQTVMQLNVLTDPFVISHVLTSTGTALYRPAQLAVTSAYPFVAGLSRQMKPLVAGYIATDNQAAIREVLLRGTRLTILLSAPFSVVLACFAFPIIKVWLGDTYAPTAMTLVVMALADVSTHVRETQGFIMTGLGRLRYIAVIQVIGGLFSFVAGFACVLVLHSLNWGYYSIVGVAAPAVISGWAQTVLISLYVGEQTGLGAFQYLSSAFARPLLVLLISALVASLLNWWFAPTSFLDLAASATCAGLVCISLAWTFGLDAVDRRRVKGILTRIISRARSTGSVT